MTDDKPRPSSTALEHLAEIYRLLNRNESRIAGLTRHLEELLAMLEEPKSPKPSEDRETDGSP